MYCLPTYAAHLTVWVKTADFEEAFQSKGIQNYRDLLKQLCYQDKNHYRAPVTSCSFIGKSSTVSHEARAFAAASDLNRKLISVLSYTHDPSLPLDLVFNSDSLTVLSCFSPSIVLSSQRILNCLEICLSNFKQIIDLFPRACIIANYIPNTFNIANASSKSI